MKIYNKTDLATIIKAIIVEKYSDPEYFYEELKTNINAKMKAANKHVLTVEEYKTKGLGLANWLIKDFDVITIQSIEARISPAIIKEPGNDVAEYKDYVFKAVKEIIREFTNIRYKSLNAQIKKRSGKRK